MTYDMVTPDLTRTTAGNHELCDLSYKFLTVIFFFVRKRKQFFGKRATTRGAEMARRIESGEERSGERRGGRPF
jgi:hypothetical protein